MHSLVSIHMACNNPDNGDFAGRVCQIALPDEAIQLTARAWNIMSYRGCPKLREQQHGNFVLSGKRWSYVRRRSWVGNWCWDGYAMIATQATEFMVWLHKRDLFQCEGGWSDLCEAWDKPAPLVLPEKWWVA